MVPESSRLTAETGGGGFEEIPHTADLSLRVWGKDLKTLFANAAIGMMTLICDLSTIRLSGVRRTVTLDAIDVESLLVEWLSEVAYLVESEGLVFPSFTILHITDTQLTASLDVGITTEVKRFIKAATFHNLQVMETERGMETIVVFDV